MAPSFIRELRRRSKASIRTERSVEVSTERPPLPGNGTSSEQVTPTGESQASEYSRPAQPQQRRFSQRMRSADLYNTDTSSDASRNTAPTNGSLTPPSNHGSDPALDQQLRQEGNGMPSRPSPQPISNSKRSSVSGMSGLGSSVEINGLANVPRSIYEPRVLNHPGSRPVYQKTLALFGTVGDPTRHTVDGWVTVSRKNDRFPPTHWPVRDSRWKAVVYLEPGPNEIQFTTWTEKLANASSSNPIHTSFATISMIPPHSAPPLQLAILLAKDSPETFDSVPQKRLNDLPTAIRKYRTAAYLWQAFVTESMRREKLDCRSFTFEEEWGHSTSHIVDRENGIMRSEARVHIIRTDKTVAELRDLERGQQDKKDASNGKLFDVAANAVNNYFKPLPGEKRYVSVLIMDTHWDKESQTTLGHAAKGGQSGDLSLAVFGSHLLHSYPEGLDEVRTAFEDCTRTDTDFVANDSNCTGSSWEAASFGLGSHLHEIARLFGCRTQSSGIMAGEFKTFNRTFMSSEPYSTRTKSKAGSIARGDECTLHRLDCLRFRHHPCFRLPTDEFHPFDDSVQAYPIEGGKVVLKARSRISHLEIWAESDEVCRAWEEWPADRLGNNICLTEQDLRDRLPEDKRKEKIRVKIFSGAGGCQQIDDFTKLCSKDSALKLNSSPGPLAKTAFRSHRVGLPVTSGSEVQEVVFTSVTSKESRILTRVTAYHDTAVVYGLEFGYDDSSTQLLGSREGNPGGQTVELDLRRGEYISGFYIREKSGIIGVGIMTSTGRATAIFGDAFGGAANNIIPPRGFSICGVTGTQGSRLESFGVIITR